MKVDELELTFLPAPDDADPTSREYQTALWAADKELRAHVAKTRSSVFVQDDVDAAMAHLGQIAVPLGTAAITGIGVAVAAWVQGRYGRKVRLEYRDAHGDVKVEARTTEEVRQLLGQIPSDRLPSPKKSDQP